MCCKFYFCGYSVPFCQSLPCKCQWLRFFSIWLTLLWCFYLNFHFLPGLCPLHPLTSFPGKVSVITRQAAITGISSSHLHELSEWQSLRDVRSPRPILNGTFSLPPGYIVLRSSLETFAHRQVVANPAWQKDRGREGRPRDRCNCPLVTHSTRSRACVSTRPGDSHPFSFHLSTILFPQFLHLLFLLQNSTVFKTLKYFLPNSLPLLPNYFFVLSWRVLQIGFSRWQTQTEFRVLSIQQRAPLGQTPVKAKGENRNGQREKPSGPAGPWELGQAMEQLWS